MPKVLQLVIICINISLWPKNSAPNLSSYLPYLLHRDIEDKMNSRLEKYFERGKHYIIIPANYNFSQYMAHSPSHPSLYMNPKFYIASVLCSTKQLGKAGEQCDPV